MLTSDHVRRWYPQDDAVHGFDHVLRVLRLAEALAQAEGADVEIVRAAVLFHDAADPGRTPEQAGERRSSHQHTSAEIAAQALQAEGWADERIAAVQHAIRAHRFRDPSERPQTLEAQVLFDADKLDAIGAMGVARAIAYAAQHGMPAFAQVSDYFIETGRPEPGELHSAYHEYCFKLRHIHERLYTHAGRRLAEERHRRMALFFEQLFDEAHLP